MISLILPYWNRQEATDASLCLMAQHYMDLDLEIIVVDDGSPVAYEKPTLLPLDIQVVRLPMKLIPKNPCTPLNVGFSHAKGEYIAISNPENLHRTPILGEMRDSIKTDKDYVLAAAWCPEQNRWHCHSSMERSDDNDVGRYLPKGSQYHFMSMMKKSLWPGFDEDYRQGGGYDDPDFVRRLNKAGANFIMRDDLVVDHIKTGAKTNWPAGGHARNRQVFMSKWLPL